MWKFQCENPWCGNTFLSLRPYLLLVIDVIKACPSLVHALYGLYSVPYCHKLITCTVYAGTISHLPLYKFSLNDAVSCIQERLLSMQKHFQTLEIVYCMLTKHSYLLFMHTFKVINGNTVHVLSRINLYSFHIKTYMYNNFYRCTLIMSTKTRRVTSICVVLFWRLMGFYTTDVSSSLEGAWAGVYSEIHYDSSGQHSLCVYMANTATSHLRAARVAQSK